MNATALFGGVFFGAIGLGYFTYGKRQRAGVPLVCGLLLMVFPYFVSGALPMLLIGAALAAVPFFLRA